MAEFQHVQLHDRVNLGSQGSARAVTFTEAVASMVATPLQGINFHARSLAKHKFPCTCPCKTLISMMIVMSIPLFHYSAIPLFLLAPPMLYVLISTVSSSRHTCSNH